MYASMFYWYGICFVYATQSEAEFESSVWFLCLFMVVNCVKVMKADPNLEDGGCVSFSAAELSETSVMHVIRHIIFFLRCQGKIFIN